MRLRITAFPQHVPDGAGGLKVSARYEIERKRLWWWERHPQSYTLGYPDRASARVALSILTERPTVYCVDRSTSVL